MGDRSDQPHCGNSTSETAALVDQLSLETDPIGTGDVASRRTRTRLREEKQWVTDLISLIVATRLRRQRRLSISYRSRLIRLEPGMLRHAVHEPGCARRSNG